MFLQHTEIKALVNTLLRRINSNLFTCWGKFLILYEITMETLPFLLYN